MGVRNVDGEWEFEMFMGEFEMLTRVGVRNVDGGVRNVDGGVRNVDGVGVRSVDGDGGSKC